MDGEFFFQKVESVVFRCSRMQALIQNLKGRLDAFSYYKQKRDK
jgi:hypothetical protein